MREVTEKYNYVIYELSVAGMKIKELNIFGSKYFLPEGAYRSS